MKNLKIAIRYTLLMTLLLGVAYPLLVTALAQTFWRDKANGQLLTRNGQIIGSSLIGQSFNAPQYFHSRPSAVNYDAGTSGGSNLGPTSAKLIERIKADVQRLQVERPDVPVPVELVTTSASGLDPHLSPAAIEFQLPRVARARGISEDELRRLIAAHTEARTFGFLGEPRVNVLQLNLALDEWKQ
ncbi:MAG: potassium-transporting ATPase subunit KdpC [Acidobacteria bacterium]|nr:potassium-transporting ATPase subunit KdpC [Acidobacteriota bacterium]